MKKIAVIFMIFLMCLSIYSCNNDEAYEVAEKLDGVWVATWNSALGEMGNIYKFEYSGQDAGTCEFYNVMDGEAFVHYGSGVFMVSDGEITMDFRASIDKYGNIEPFEAVRTLTLSYTYEDGELIVMDGDRQFIQTSK